jgi:hypothetical protein
VADDVRTALRSFETKLTELLSEWNRLKVLVETEPEPTVQRDRGGAETSFGESWRFPFPAELPVSVFSDD